MWGPLASANPTCGRLDSIHNVLKPRVLGVDDAAAASDQLRHAILPDQWCEPPSKNPSAGLEYP